MLIVVLIVTGIILLMFASGLYIFCVACCRGKDMNWLDEQSVSTTPYKKYYSRVVAADRFLKDNGAQDVFITAQDGIRLHGLWTPAQGAKGTIILMHGYRSTYMVDFSMALEFYLHAGFNLLIPDQRAHGKSEGKFITFGVKESRDLLDWIGFHNRNFGQFPLILSGLSMGASTVLFVADENLPLNVKGIIADCGFSSPKEILSQVYKNVTHLPPCLSMWATELCARAFAGFSIYEKNTITTLSSTSIPVLMIHGRDDTFVPCTMTERGYAACNSKKRLLLVDGAEHGVSFIHDREGYIGAVTDFLIENVDGFTVDG